MDVGEDLNPNCRYDATDGPGVSDNYGTYEIRQSENVMPAIPDMKLQQFECIPDLKMAAISPTDSAFIYKNTHPKRGICLIVSNDKFDRQVNMPDRSGSHADISNAYKAFSSIDFHCLLIQNVAMRQLRRVFADMANRDHSASDCFACVLLSHGEEGQIYATDGLVRIDDLIAPFKGDACPSLAGKPKLFFVQACRGNRLDDGVETVSANPDVESDFSVTNPERTQRIPVEADILVAYSVVPGFYSWRNSRSGSWFFQAIASVFTKYGRSLDLLQLLTRVNRKVAYEFESNASSPLMSKKKQIPSIVSMLTKEVYFPSKPIS